MGSGGVYPQFSEFHEAVDLAVREHLDPESASGSSQTSVAFGESLDLEMDPRRDEDLRGLFGEMRETAAGLLDIPASSINGTISWSRTFVRGWLARSYYSTGDPRHTSSIRVNNMLQNVDVPRETMRFLLWHAFLHLYLRTGHTQRFRELESSWPECDACALNIIEIADSRGLPRSC